ncbi:hypothetical protein G5V57_07035 [Nordella sp. HKS 07]|nr:hypothetical protein [Nordella sp. HKS 07]QIG47502.1 hypothetical protein G5V57_07035 [Nordella sp. HKS 07]
MKVKARHRSIRLQIMLDATEVAALEDWRFKRRMPSRASAVREIIRRGLAAEGFEIASIGQKSADFGIVETGEEN